MFRLARRAVALGPRGWMDLALLALLGLLAEFGVRRRPLPRVARWFGLRLTGIPAPGTGWCLTPRQHDRRRVVRMLVRHWPLADRSGLCLREALLTGWILRERDPMLRVGVARVGGSVTAHAWVEFDGAALGADGSHTPLSFE